MDPTTLARAIGANLRRIRDSRGWSQGRVARESGLSQPFLSQMERGEKPPSLETLLALARAFGEPVGAFLTGIGPEPANAVPARVSKKSPEVK